MSQPSSTLRTVFVRFVPPSANIRRHHLEDLFSQIGPIKKSSVIVPHAKSGNKKEGEEETTTTCASSYGFVKYLSEDDALKAAQKLDRTMLRVSTEEQVRLRVERAADVAGNKHKKKAQDNADNTESHQESHDDIVSHKKTNRLIIRNLSFYAKVSHIRQALQEFGPIEEIHLPTVSDHKDSKTKSFHRGFGFVTFANAKDAHQCLQAKNVEIYKRKVQIEKALHKAAYEKLKNHDTVDNSRHFKGDETKNSLESKTGEIEDDDSSSASSSDSDSTGDGNDEAYMKIDKDGSGSDSDGDSSSSSESDSDDSEEDDEEHGEEQDKREQTAANDTEAVAEKRCVFLRNLPFDATRHDLFEALRKFGRISGIYVVKDKQSGLARGTAFVSFEKAGAAQRLIEASGSGTFASQRDVTEGKQKVLDREILGGDSDGIFIRGRRIFMNLAVDKDTASTLTLDKKSDQGKQVGKDRRNMYLKGEGRVDNDEENNLSLWDQLPEQDKLKRQKAWSEKNSKLKSPLFLISPTRLSIRNIAKDVDERILKKLCVNAVTRGLQKKLVTAEDQIKHWRAAGQMTTREILEKVDKCQQKDDILPEFDAKNIRKFLPSVTIERDFSSSKKEGAPSRGFGFVEFVHHVHALACLRELNNNAAYTEEYVSGGRQAMVQKSRKLKKKRKAGEEGLVKVPRLIVEFAVENRAKARKQAEHKAHQLANTIKQRLEHKEKSAGDEQEKEKKSRGQRQRERKRKERESGSANSNDPAMDTIPLTNVNPSTPGDDNAASHHAGAKSKKPSKKKRKVDADEEKLSKLVNSYESSNASDKQETAKGEGHQRKKKEKRWYED